MPDLELGTEGAPMNKTPSLTLETYCLIGDRDQQMNSDNLETMQ